MRNQYNDQLGVSPVRYNNVEEEAMGQSETKKSRNRHLVMINQLRKKEESWNGRFYLEQIPRYNCIEDRNCETYKKILVKKRTKQFVVKKESKGHTLLGFEGPRKKLGDESDATAFAAKRPESHDRPPIDIRVRGMYGGVEVKPRDKARAESMKRTGTTDTLLKEKKVLQERLLATWDRLSIPMFHRESFVKCENIQNLKQTVENIKKEIDEIETNCSSVQMAIKAVTARENCLKQLRNVITKFSQHAEGQEVEGFNEEELKQKSVELLSHLRLISLNVIETILKWREYIHQTFYSSRNTTKATQLMSVPFIYNQSNYLIKMKTDTKDLIDTPLSKYFSFSNKSDPFFIEPASDEQPGKLLLTIPKNLLSRIRACDFTLENEVAVDIPKNNEPHSPLTPPLQNYATSSDRSLKKDQKTNNIKIRNTSLNKPRKEAQESKADKSLQNTANSHSSSRNNITDSEVENKVKDLSEVNALTDRLNQEKPGLPVPTPKQSKQEPAKQESVKQEASKQEPVKQQVVEQPKPEVIEEKMESASSSVKPVDLYEDEMDGYLNKYLQKIDQNMKDSFISDPTVLLERANMGQDPIWFELVEVSGAEKKTGLAVAHIDNTVFTARRMVILHFTTEDREMYHDFLAQFIEHLWKNDECNEIKISLYHLEDANGNFGSDKNLEQAIKKLGFRWKQLTNDKYTGKRYIDYIIKRPEGVVCTVAKATDEPIHVRSVVVLSDLEGGNGGRTSNCLFDNRYAILNAALKHCEEKLDKLSDNDTQRAKNYLQVISSLATGKKKIGGFIEKFENLDGLQAFVTEKLAEKADLAPQIDAKHSKNIFTTSLLNLIYRWKSYNITSHKVEGKNRKYLKINNNSDLVQFQSKYKNSSVYFIPTDDNEVNMFITDNDAIINEILNKEEIIEDSVSKLFSKLEKNPTSFKEDLWVPLFSLKENNVDLEDAKNLLKGEYKLNYATNTCEIGLNGARVLGNLKVRPSEKSKIIEKPFLIGILHEQVDFPLFSVVVQPQDFMHSDN